jgi:hypothetical protein
MTVTGMLKTAYPQEANCLSGKRDEKEVTNFKIDGSDFYFSHSESKATVTIISRVGQKSTVRQASVMMLSAA